MRIGNRTHVFEWYHFQWPLTTRNPYFIIWRWLSQKRYEIQTLLQWNTSRNLHTKTYTQGCYFVISNDLEWSWVTQRNIQWFEASRGLSATAELLVHFRLQILPTTDCWCPTQRTAFTNCSMITRRIAGTRWFPGHVLHRAKQSTRRYQYVRRTSKRCH